MTKDNGHFKGRYKVEFIQQMDRILKKKSEGFPLTKIHEELHKEGLYSGTLRGFRYNYSQLIGEAKQPVTKASAHTGGSGAEKPNDQTEKRSIYTKEERLDASTEDSSEGPKTVKVFGVGDEDKFGAKAANKLNDDDLF